MAIVMGLLATALASAPSGTPPATAQLLPTVYEAGHFYAVPETRDGQRLRLVVDTGGGGGSGMYWISKTAAQRLQLQSGNCTVDGRQMPVAQLPDYLQGRTWPAATGQGPVRLGAAGLSAS